MSNVDVIKRLYEAFAVGDIDTVFELIAPSVEWIEPD